MPSEGSDGIGGGKFAYFSRVGRRNGRHTVYKPQYRLQWPPV
ncbi:TPA: hypothetical protein ACFRHD_002133 [Neisseria lactamica]